ncbi:MAG: AAA family ATPase [Kiritimatiellia bacterium]|nr:AAA family ATPase [Kiritimatiellia bacterium]
MTANHILITGLSGVGKTSVVHELRRRGIRCVDMDEPGWSSMDSMGHQHWNVERLGCALAEAAHDTLVVSGCAEEQASFYPDFRLIILLSAPRQVMMERIRSRSNNRYGQNPEEMAHILPDLDRIEPLLRQKCTHELKTTVPVRIVADRILHQIGSCRLANSETF